MGLPEAGLSFSPMGQTSPFMLTRACLRYPRDALAQRYGDPAENVMNPTAERRGAAISIHLKLGSRSNVLYHGEIPRVTRMSAVCHHVKLRPDGLD
jgi:hypothetical protein